MNPDHDHEKQRKSLPGNISTKYLLVDRSVHLVVC